LKNAIGPGIAWDAPTEEDVVILDFVLNNKKND
jgi:hypothetical protein